MSFTCKARSQVAVSFLPAMNPKFLIEQHEDLIVHRWAEEIYRDRRTGHAAALSYRQLVHHLPDLLDEFAHLLETNASRYEMAETAVRLRPFIYVRFQQGCLIDEVAHELTVLREVLAEFWWREFDKSAENDLRELRRFLWCGHALLDELIEQVIVVYAANYRPPVRTRASVWPPPRRHKNDSTNY